jgi:hypothetical protein
MYEEGPLVMSRLTKLLNLLNQTVHLQCVLSYYVPLLFASSDKKMRLLCFQNGTDWFWGPPKSYVMFNMCYSKKKSEGLKVTALYIYSLEEFKNMWNHTFTLLYDFVTCTGKLHLLPQY